MKIVNLVLILLISFFAAAAEEAEYITENSRESEILILDSNLSSFVNTSEIMVEELVAFSDVCAIMPGSCACDFVGPGGHEDEDEFEACLDDRYGPE